MKKIEISKMLFDFIINQIAFDNKISFQPEFSGMDFSVYFEKPINDDLIHSSLYNWIKDEVFSLSEIIDNGRFQGQFNFEIESTSKNLLLSSKLSWFEEDSYEPYHSETISYIIHSE
jgi:hypothetical protein